MNNAQSKKTKKSVKAWTMLFIFQAFLFSTYAKENSGTSTAPSAEPVDVAQVDFSQPKHSLGVGLGQTFLVGDFEKLGDDRIGLDLLYEYAASHSFDFTVDVHYSKHKSKGTRVTLPGLAAGIKAKVFQFDQFSPFFVAGLGLYRPVVTREVNSNLQESKAKTTFGWNLGAGADLRLNQVAKVGLLLHYHNPFDIKQDDGPEVEGSYYKLMFLTMYSF